MITRYSSRRESLEDSLLQKLKNAKKYDRISGYFTSSLFSVAVDIFDSVGKIRIVCNSELIKEDVQIAKHSLNMIKKEWNQKEIKNLINEKLRFKKLYQYLKEGKLEVRIIPSYLFGLMHGKAGVITLEDGTKTSFLGSSNDSIYGWRKNYELIWEDNSKEAIEWIESEFETLWNHSYAIPLPDFIVKDIKRLGYENIVYKIEDIEEKDVPAATTLNTPIYKQYLGLWEHQKYFIEKAYSDYVKLGNARYLLADPVGLGKTIQLAITAQLMALSSDKPLLFIVPKSLMMQWQEELRDMLNIPSAIWDNEYWIDENGKRYTEYKKRDILSCPRRIGIVSQGLIVAKSKTANPLLNIEYECVIVDEAHHARRKQFFSNKSPRSFQKNNLYSYLLKLSKKTKSLLLATATPIQIDPIELWDLLNILNQTANRILGNENSKWRKKTLIKKGFEKVQSNGNHLSYSEKWGWAKNPLPHSFENRNCELIRNSENLTKKEASLGKSFYELSPMLQNSAKIFLDDYFKFYNPYIRHVVRRERKYLENKINPKTKRPYLEKIDVKIIDEPPLVLTLHMRQAYRYAEQFCQLVAQRKKTGGFLKTILLRRIGSSIEAGKQTGLKLLNKWDVIGYSAEEDSVYDNPKSLTPEELKLLEKFIDELERNKEEDPKFYKLVELLNRDKWIKEGVIIFSQYFDTVQWIARKLSKIFERQKIGVYAGGYHSGYYLNNVFHKETKETVKNMVMNYEIKILMGTDAASEGLNLQTLRRLVNIDLPWNPTRLEQRKGRIQRSGQKYKEIFLYNMRYKDSVEDKVHSILSKRLHSITQMFGQLPDILEDVWIDVSLNRIENAKKTVDGIPQKHPFEIKYNENVQARDWEKCTTILDEHTKLERLKNPWSIKIKDN